MWLFFWVRSRAAVPLSSDQSHHRGDGHPPEQSGWWSSGAGQRPAAPEGQPPPLTCSYRLDCVSESICSWCVCSAVAVCKWCEGDVLLPVDCRLLGRLHRPDNRNSCKFFSQDTAKVLEPVENIVPFDLRSPTVLNLFSNSSLHLPRVQPHSKQRRACDIWASTSRLLGPARLSDTSWEERRCLWGQFSLMHLLTVLLLQDYKEFHMDLTMKSSVVR